jgi:HIRAN domain
MAPPNCRASQHCGSLKQDVDALRSDLSPFACSPARSGRPVPAYSAAPTRVYELPRGAHFAVHGESFRQGAIGALRATCKPHPAEDRRLACDVRLVAEPTNPYDSNAIAVHSSCGQVGYLPRDVAPDFAALFAELHRLGYDGAGCGAVMIGGEPGRVYLGVVLLLSGPRVCMDDLVRSQTRKSVPS